MNTKKSTIKKVRDSISKLIGEDGVFLNEKYGRLVITTSNQINDSLYPLLSKNSLSSLIGIDYFDEIINQGRLTLAAAIESIGDIGDCAIVRKKDGSDYWKMILRDASIDGHWRTQSFDRKGFMGHSSFATEELAIRDAADTGYTIRDDGALDRIQDTYEFQKGLYSTNLINQVNSGELSFNDANHRLMVYLESSQVAYSLLKNKAQAFITENGDAIYLLADRINEGEEASVFMHEIFHRYGKSILGHQGIDKILRTLDKWSLNPIGSVEKIIYDNAHERALLATDTKKILFNEEFLAYAVEEAVKIGVKPSATMPEQTAQGWLNTVSTTLKDIAATLLNGTSIDFDAQALVDLTYAMAQLDNPMRASQIRDQLTEQEISLLQGYISRKGQSNWYSQLQTNIRQNSQGVMSSQHWFEWINAQTKHGIKPDEIEWSGIREWLELQEGKIKKESILEYLDSNGVTVNEVILGGKDQNLSFDQVQELLKKGQGVHAVEKRNIENIQKITFDDNKTILPYVFNHQNLYLFREGSPEDAEKRKVGTKYDDYVLNGGTNYREIILSIDGKDIDNLNHKSLHWEQSNVLAHIRVTDRIDDQGNKTLFIEEIQSDWNSQQRKNNANVDVPFIDKTQSWLSLCLKRILKLSADEGYDRVAFINGQQSAQRYDMSQTISGIEYSSPSANIFKVQATDKEGHLLFSSVFTSQNELVAKLGKQLTEKIITTVKPQTQWMSDLELSVGGDGMHSFYDKIIPNTLKDLLKKFGINDLMDIKFNSQKIIKKGSTYQINIDNEIKKFGSLISAQEYGQKFGSVDMQQKGFQVNSRIRETAHYGMPLFSLELLDAVAQYDHENNNDLSKAQGQCASVISQYIGTDQWMKSPNGLPTKLTQSQWVLVRTENFKKWFGDWENNPLQASQAIDGKTHEPCVMYHGSQKAGFSKFDANQRYLNNKNTVPAIFFSTEKDVAMSYSGTSEDVNITQGQIDEDGYKIEPEAGIYSCFLNIREPYIEDFEGANWDGSRAEQLMVVDEDDTPISNDEGRIYFQSYERDLAQELMDKNPGSSLVDAEDKFESTNMVTNEAKQSGCDGVLIYDVVDSGKFSNYGERSHVFVVFDGKQIKSATDNTGEFNSDNWDIRYSFAGENANISKDDQYQLSLAKKRLENNDDIEKVRIETGWFKGLDDKWRFEINDSEAEFITFYSKLSVDIEQGTKLFKLLKHDKLFAAYPELKGIQVEIDPYLKDQASFDNNSKTIFLPKLPKIAWGSKSLEETQYMGFLLHEITHAIQSVEGFAAGGDGLEKSNKQLKRPQNEPIETQTNKLISILKQYQKLAGEVEARNVEYRAQMTDEQRKDLSPVATMDVDKEDVIVVFNGVEKQVLYNTSNLKLKHQSQKSSFNKWFDDKPGQTNSPEFANWFRNSVVVDGIGQPLKLYHGTSSDFSTFKLTRSGEFGPAIYVTDNPREACEYAVGQQKAGVNIMPVYLSISNPFNGGVDEFWKRFGKDDGDEKAVERAKLAGFDGVICQRDERYYDNEIKEFIDTGKKLTHYIVFDAGKIKSAIGNNGFFNSQDNDIRHSFNNYNEHAKIVNLLSTDFKNSDQLRESIPLGVNAAFNRWFSGSKVVDDEGNPAIMYHSTVADFVSFKRGKNDIGMHFGTKGQAEDRYLLKISKDPYGPELRNVQHSTMPVYINIKNPLRMTDIGAWDMENLAFGLPEEFTDWEKSSARTIAQVRDLIKSHGYDGIVYKNTGETGGGALYRKAMNDAWSQVRLAFPNRNSFSILEQQNPVYIAYQNAYEKYKSFRETNSDDSWIAFDPKQIKSAIGNNGMYNTKSTDIRYSINNQNQYKQNRPCPGF